MTYKYKDMEARSNNGDSAKNSKGISRIDEFSSGELFGWSSRR